MKVDFSINIAHLVSVVCLIGSVVAIFFKTQGRSNAKTEKLSTEIDQHSRDIAENSNEIKSIWRIISDSGAHLAVLHEKIKNIDELVKSISKELRELSRKMKG
jgi:septal ring factor EnvC (AmiA/AmiB activator)